jgi:hypothetical protein
MSSTSEKTSRFLDYLPPIIAFAAAIGALVGTSKWDEHAVGFSRIRPLGWAVLGVGVLALISSFLVTRRNHHTQVAQRAVREEIAALGRRHILRGLDRIVCIFRGFSVWHGKLPEPESPLELLEPERRSILAAINLNSLSPYADGKGSVKWWLMFETTAKEGSREIVEALQIYVTFLEPAAIHAVTRLLNCDFLRVHLIHIHDIIDANTTHDSDRKVTFFWVDNSEQPRCGYETFWNCVAEVLRLCSDEETSSGQPRFWRDERMGN